MIFSYNVFNLIFLMPFYMNLFDIFRTSLTIPDILNEKVVQFFYLQYLDMHILCENLRVFKTLKIVKSELCKRDY